MKRASITAGCLYRVDLYEPLYRVDSTLCINQPRTEDSWRSRLDGLAGCSDAGLAVLELLFGHALGHPQ